MNRPRIKDYFAEKADVKTVHNEYINSPHLYRYASDLDRYIDDLEDKLSERVDKDELSDKHRTKALSIQSVLNWVACKDELPKHETDVICYCLDFEVRIGRKTGDFWFIDGYSLPQDITHWQELPEPPCL